MSGYDHIIVGAGPAGCVASARLAASGAKVLLIEAGLEPAAVLGAAAADGTRLVLEGLNWPHEVNLRTSASLARRQVQPRWAAYRYPVGQAMGGSTAVNGCLALPALPGDFRTWAGMGLPDWSWDAVSPWWTRVGEYWPVSTASPEQVHPVDASFLRHCASQAIPETDLSVPAKGIGAGLLPTFTRDGTRITAADALLGQPWPTLTVRLGCQARRVRCANGTVTGVELLSSKGLDIVHSDSVILAAGALGTPPLLQRSGIGDPALTRQWDMPVIADLPAVGRHLMDHASLVIWATTSLAPSSRHRWRSSAALLPAGGGDVPEVLVGPLHDIETNAIPALRGRTPNLMGISTMLMRPASMGSVRTLVDDPFALPQVELALLEDDRDLETMSSAIEWAWDALHGQGLGEYIVQVQSWSNRVIDSPRARHSAVRELTAPGWHACGTARMGSSQDRNTVVDEAGRVHGVAGLRIIDASVFPAMVSTPTAWTTAVVAERLVDHLISGGFTQPASDRGKDR